MVSKFGVFSSVFFSSLERISLAINCRVTRGNNYKKQLGNQRKDTNFQPVSI